jgi:hypothetical protein
MAQPRRTKQFVDASVQGALARRIIVHWLLFLIVAALAAFVLQVLSNPFRPLAEHARDLWWTHGPFLLVLVFLLPVFIVDTIKVSHRFAGPIFALRRALREIGEGKPPRKLKFRRKDFWHDLAEDYNAMLVKFQLVDEKTDRTNAKEEQLVAAKT